MTLYEFPGPPLMSLLVLSTSLCIAGCVTKDDDSDDGASSSTAADSAANRTETGADGNSADTPASPDSTDGAASSGSESGDPDPADGGITPGVVMSPETCEDFNCGGDLVGEWTFDNVCFGGEIQQPAAEFCPTATLTNDLDITGTLNIDEDGTYERALQMEGSVFFRIPASCLQPPLNCATLSAALNMGMGGSEDETIGSFECSQARPDAACVCEAEFVPRDESDTGTYMVEGSVVTVQSDDDDEDGESVFDFCVRDDGTATLIEQGESDDPTGGFTLRR